MGAPDARTIVGIIGNVISGFLFLSPVPTFANICKEKSVQSFKPDPYLMTVLNCAMWCFFGMPFVHPHSVLVVTINGAGLFIELIYITIFFMYSDMARRRKMAVVLLVEMAFFTTIVLITMLCLHTTTSRSSLVGIVCILMNIGMYTSPLTIMKRVIKTKSVKYMPFYLSLANFLNGVVWTVYALLRLDAYILIPNALGALSGFVQLILYATYYKTTKWNDDGLSSNQSSVELQP